MLEFCYPETKLFYNAKGEIHIAFIDFISYIKREFSCWVLTCKILLAVLSTNKSCCINNACTHSNLRVDKSHFQKQTVPSPPVETKYLRKDKACDQCKWHVSVLWVAWALQCTTTYMEVGCMVCLIYKWSCVKWKLNNFANIY